MLNNLSGKKWNGFLILSFLCFAMCVPFIVYGFIHSNLETMFGAIFFLVGGALSSYVTLVTGTVKTDENIGKNPIQSLLNNKGVKSE